MTDFSMWKCHHFSIALPQDRVPTLLRRVAKTLEKIKPEFVHDIVLKTDYTDMVATVYYTLQERTSKRSSAKTRRVRKSP
jgi:hypothetical protein